MEKIMEKIKGFLSDLMEDKKGKLIAACLVVCICCAFMVLGNGGSDGIISQEEPAVTDESMEDESISAGNIYVDIGGAVKNPMLAELPEGSRVEDAIRAADGLTDDADMTSINRAEFLTDGQKVYIPSDNQDYEAFGSDGGTGVPYSNEFSQGGSGKVNINSADSSQLQTLTGVGPATAEKIIDYRNANGRFNAIEELKKVSGIGDKTFEKMKDSITV